MSRLFVLKLMVFLQIKLSLKLLDLLLESPCLFIYLSYLIFKSLIFLAEHVQLALALLLLHLYSKLLLKHLLHLLLYYIFLLGELI